MVGRRGNNDIFIEGIIIPSHALKERRIQLNKCILLLISLHLLVHLLLEKTLYTYSPFFTLVYL